MRIAIPIIAALIAGGVMEARPAEAQSQGVQERIRRVVIFGNDRCPRGEQGEIVVCARRPDSERYRIPEQLREGEPGPEDDSWAVRAQSLETVGDTGVQSCSTVGPGGFTGCWNEMMRAYRNDRRAQPENGPNPR